MVYGRAKLTGSDLGDNGRSGAAGVDAANLRVDEVPYVTNGVCEVHPAYHPNGCAVSWGSVGVQVTLTWSHRPNGVEY